MSRAACEEVLLRADDPRHGTLAGRSAHIKRGGPVCGACRDAYNRWEKRNRASLYLRGPAWEDATGTQRRIRALAAIGHSLRSLDRRLGRKVSYSAFILRETMVKRETAAAYVHLYERLCMTRPEGVIADRTRLVASGKDWPPPLAWDDIDDPTEQPADWQYSPADRGDLFDDAVAQGLSLSETCAVMDVGSQALEKWADRNGRRVAFNRLLARERGVA